MSSRIAVGVPRRRIATTIALAVMFCLLGTLATAQVTIQPKEEIFLGYSWLGVSGHADLNTPVQDINTGFNGSITYFFPFAHNLGITFDGSGHFAVNHPDFTGIGFAMAGLEYKYHTNSFSPFVHFMAGAANLSPAFPPTPPNANNEWQAALAAGGGIDYTLTHRFTLRVAQADYIYTNYSIYCAAIVNFVCIPSNETSQWNNIRLSTGLVLNLGNYYTAPPTAACTATPTEVTEGEPVTVSATGTNFNPKHTVTYAWTTNGGKLDSMDKQSARIDTTGVNGGSYTANATISDPKMKKGGSATCSANFNVKPRPTNPPVVSCSANPPTVQTGTPSTISTTATSPDNAQITGVTYTASAGNISGTGNTATLDTTGLPAGPVTVTATATDARSLVGSGICTVNVEVPQPPTCSKINSIQFPDLKRPWRVDNTAKAILDDVASRLKADPNAKIVITGYADGEKPPMIGTGKNKKPMDLAAERAVNAKAYLVQEQGIDPSRIDVRTGTGQQKVADIVWVPQGADVKTCADLQNTTPVDESVIKPNQTKWPTGNVPPEKPSHHSKKKGAAAPQQ